MQAEEQIQELGGEEVALPPITTRPVGSLEKIKQLGWDPNRFHTCSEPVQGENLGCRVWQKCRLSCKGDRPHYFGVQVAKAPSRGSGIIQTIKPCYDIVDYHQKLQVSKFYQKIVKPEGGKIKRRGSKVIRTYMDAGKQIQEFAPATWDETVPVFPEPEENPALVKHAYAAAVVQEQEQASADYAERMATGGIKDDLTDAPASDAGVGAHAAGGKGPRGKT